MLFIRFTDTITISFISALGNFNYELKVLNYCDFGRTESINFPLNSAASRTKVFNYKVPGYQYVKKLQLQIHYYQLDDILNVYLNNKHIHSSTRVSSCSHKGPDCVSNQTFNYTFDFFLSSEDLNITVQLVNVEYDGLLTDAWISLKAIY